MINGNLCYIITIKWQPMLYYNNKRFFLTYEENKKIDLNYTIFGYWYNQWVWSQKVKNRICWQQPHNETTKYLSLLCPVPEKEIKLIYNNTYELTTTVKYGWTMFCICHTNYQQFSKWLICTNPLRYENEILLISCDKPNFSMYMLYNKKSAYVTFKSMFVKFIPK
jgi:hypothetical protein